MGLRYLKSIKGRLRINIVAVGKLVMERDRTLAKTITALAWIILYPDLPKIAIISRFEESGRLCAHDKFNWVFLIKFWYFDSIFIEICSLRSDWSQYWLKKMACRRTSATPLSELMLTKFIHTYMPQSVISEQWCLLWHCFHIMLWF